MVVSKRWGGGEPELLAAILDQFKELISPGKNKAFDHPRNKFNPHYGEMFWAADFPFAQSDGQSNAFCVNLTPPSLYEARGYIMATRLYSNLDKRKSHHLSLLGVEGRESFLRGGVLLIPLAKVKKGSLALNHRRLLPSPQMAEIAEYIFAHFDKVIHERRKNAYFEEKNSSPSRDLATDRNVVAAASVQDQRLQK